MLGEVVVDESIVINRFRDSSPVVFLRGEYVRKSPFVIVKSKNRTIVANTFPIEHIRAKRSSRRNRNTFLVNTALINELENPDSICVELVDPNRSVFVYGTLLSKYWDPHTGDLYEGWYSLREDMMVRGIIKGMEAVWPEDYSYPFGISKEGKIVLGEIYFNLSREDISYLDDAEYGYKRKKATIYPVENVPNCIPFEAWVYEYQRSIRGFSADTYRYGDAYYIKGIKKYVYYRFSRDLYVKWLWGNIPVILTCPHGGYLRPNNIPIDVDVNSDKRTFEITEDLVRKIFEMSEGDILPSVVMCRIHRSRVDLNRPYKPLNTDAVKIYDLFHSMILKMINKLRQEYGKVIILDIHGMKDNEEEIILGTNYGKSVEDIPEWYSEIRGVLEEKFVIGVDEPGYSGYYITQEYGALKGVGVIQIEIAKRVRMNDELLRELIYRIAKAIRNIFS